MPASAWVAAAAARRQAALAFGAVLRAARAERGLTQEALACLAAFDRTYPSLLERGLRTPTLGVIFRLSDVLNIPAECLVADAHARLRSASHDCPERANHSLT
jgi:transcriptional regulator with XRE-family HTH domain